MKKKDYIQQYKDLKKFFKEYIGEPKLNHLISHPDMKTKNPFEIIDLRHQPEPITPEKDSTIS